ncbi:MAG: cytochrome c biogenesis protein CcdA [Acidobacteriota bacterium]
MEGLLSQFGNLIETAPVLAFGAAFLGGLLTASNPCVLVSIPLVLAYVGGSEQASSLRRSMLYALSMVAGLALTFTVLGLAAALLGRLFGVQGRFWPYLIGGVCLVMGLHMLGWLPLRLGLALPLRPRSRGALGAFLLGILFGVISTPCAVPILAVLLAFIAAKGSVLYGGGLLLTYALGHCMLVLLAGVSMGAVRGLLSSRRWASANLWLRRGAGALILCLGLYVIGAPLMGGA